MHPPPSLSLSSLSLSLSLSLFLTRVGQQRADWAGRSGWGRGWQPGLWIWQLLLRRGHGGPPPLWRGRYGSSGAGAVGLVRPARLVSRDEEERWRIWRQCSGRAAWTECGGGVAVRRAQARAVDGEMAWRGHPRVSDFFIFTRLTKPDTKGSRLVVHLQKPWL